MPSGAKKRKAAKKKKENRPTAHENQPPHSAPAGDVEDSKNHAHEDKDSDLGKGERIEAKEPQIDGIEKQKPSEEESSVRIERDSIIEDEYTTKNNEPSFNPYEVGSSRGSTPTSNCSSSENEPHDVATTKISSTNAVEKPIEESGDSISANSPAADSEKTPSSSGKAELVSSKGDSSLNPCSFEPVTEEDGQGKQTSVKDRAAEVEKSYEVLDPNESLAQESDKNLAVSYVATKPTSDIGVVSEPDSGFTQPYIAEPPRPIQTTSWKGCCGIFELFAGSAR